MSATIRPLGPIAKRNLLASKSVSADELRAYGRQYLEQELLDDAYNFFEKAGDAAGVGEVKQRAIELGLAAMLFNILRSRLTTISRDDWLAAADNAIKRGKLAFAAQCYRKLGDEQKLQELLARMPAPTPQPP